MNKLWICTYPSTRAPQARTLSFYPTWTKREKPFWPSCKRIRWFDLRIPSVWFRSPHTYTKNAHQTE